MIKAHRLVISDLIHDNVDILPPSEIDKRGFPRIFEEDTVMFCHDSRWHATHQWSITIIHLHRHRPTSIGIPFDCINISDDKIFGPGIIIRPEDYGKHNIPIIWEEGLKTQLAFVVEKGTYITTDHNVNYIKYPNTAKFTMRQGNNRRVRGVRRKASN
jgi:hypothetical protein